MQLSHFQLPEEPKGIGEGEESSNHFSWKRPVREFLGVSVQWELQGLRITVTPAHVMLSHLSPG